VSDDIKTLTADFVLSGTTHIHSFTADFALSSPGQTASFTADAKLKLIHSFTADALITDTRGTYRGAFTTADRDDLPALQPQDTVITLDAETTDQGNITRAQYWTGSDWLSGESMQSPVSGTTNLFVAPTTAGWRVELGDPTYPVRYWNGSDTNFTVDGSGTVIAKHFIARAPTSLTPAIQTQDDTGAQIWSMASSGYIKTLGGSYTLVADMNDGTDEGYSSLIRSGLQLGPSGSGSAYDVLLQRSATGIFRITATTEMVARAAPSTPASTYLRIYNESGTLKWKSSAGTVYDLSAVTGLALNITTHAGAVSDSDFSSPTSGDIGIDTTNSRLYCRVGSTWKYVELA
jgi:hypothetical protein